jgi:hypothetical protein
MYPLITRFSFFEITRVQMIYNSPAIALSNGRVLIIPVMTVVIVFLRRPSKSIDFKTESVTFKIDFCKVCIFNNSYKIDIALRKFSCRDFFPQNELYIVPF